VAELDAAVEDEASDPALAVTSSTAVASPLFDVGAFEASERSTERMMSVYSNGDLIVIGGLKCPSVAGHLNLKRNQNVMITVPCSPSALFSDSSTHHLL
jgi:hypothetical protein